LFELRAGGRNTPLFILQYILLLSMCRQLAARAGIKSLVQIVHGRGEISEAVHW